MSGILAFLLALGCKPVFAIEHAPGLDRPGRQRGALVRVRTTDDAVLVHELWHVCQEQRLGLSTTGAESARREAEARRVELVWKEYNL